MKLKVEIMVTAEVETCGDDPLSFGEICGVLEASAFSNREWKLIVRADKMTGVRILEEAP